MACGLLVSIQALAIIKVGMPTLPLEKKKDV